MKLFIFLVGTVFIQCLSYKEFYIPLESDPLTRFNAPNEYLATSTLEFINALLKLVSDSVMTQLTQIYHDVVIKNNVEFAMELKGISQFFNITERDLFVYLFMYELFAHCTSIIAALPNGEVIHGRNLDYDFVKLLNDTSYIGIFTSDGKEVFRCVMFGGFLGSHTCMKSGKFAISLNQRMSTLGEGIEKNLQALREGSALVVWTIRQVTHKANSYEEAISILENIPLVAPAYFIVSGAGENKGAVITRERNSTLDTWRISKDKWFLVQVNTDRWEKIPPHKIDRRKPAIERIKAIGKDNMTMEKMMNEVLLMKPNNCEITIFSSVMNPTNGSFIIEVKKADGDN